MSEKKKGIVDFVMLVDATGSMGPCIGAIKETLGVLIDEISGPQSVIRDWRGRVVGFRDKKVDGSDWFVDNPFVRDVAALRSQVSALDAKGGGDEPESLLEALAQVVEAPVSESSQEDDPSKWRGGLVRRAVIVFTDATCHGDMAAIDVVNQLHAKKMSVFLFGPNEACYEELMSADKAEWFKLEKAPDYVTAMQTAAKNRDSFSRIMAAFAKTLSAEIPTEVL